MEREIENRSIVKSPTFEDTEIICVSCGIVFTFEKGEAEFFYAKGYLPPKRCPMCRKWKRFEKEHPELLDGEGG